MSKVLYPKPFTAVLAVPADLRARGAKSELECFYWHGEAPEATIAGQRAQNDAAEAYGVVLTRAPEFSIMFVFNGLHRDVYYAERRKKPEQRSPISSLVRFPVAT